MEMQANEDGVDEESVRSATVSSTFEKSDFHMHDIAPAKPGKTRYNSVKIIIIIIIIIIIMITLPVDQKKPVKLGKHEASKMI